MKHWFGILLACLVLSETRSWTSVPRVFNIAGQQKRRIERFEGSQNTEQPNGTSKKQPTVEPEQTRIKQLNAIQVAANRAEEEARKARKAAEEAQVTSAATGVAAVQDRRAAEAQEAAAQARYLQADRMRGVEVAAREAAVRGAAEAAVRGAAEAARQRDAAEARAVAAAEQAARDQVAAVAAVVVERDAAVAAVAAAEGRVAAAEQAARDQVAAAEQAARDQVAAAEGRVAAAEQAARDQVAAAEQARVAAEQARVVDEAKVAALRTALVELIRKVQGRVPPLLTEPPLLDAGDPFVVAFKAAARSDAEFRGDALVSPVLVAYPPL